MNNPDNPYSDPGSARKENEPDNQRDSPSAPNQNRLASFLRRPLYKFPEKKNRSRQGGAKAKKDGSADRVGGADSDSGKEDGSGNNDEQISRANHDDGFVTRLMNIFVPEDEEDDSVANNPFRLKSNGAWSADLCCCCLDICACTELCYCFPCQVAKQYHLAKYGRVGCDYPLCCLLHCVPFMILCFGCSTRNKTRKRYAIDGNACFDYLTTCYCVFCSHVQILRQMTRMEEFPGACCYSADSAEAPQ